MYPPLIETDSHPFNRIAKVAAGDVASAVVSWQNGRLLRDAPVISAGFDYSLPWTRDTAALALLGAGLLYPEAMTNTLLAVMEEGEPPRIGGQYWDKVSWIPAVVHHAHASGDAALLELAIEAGRNSVAELERDEFDFELGLFRGGAFFQDGVSAYPDRYVGDGTYSDVMDIPVHNPDLRAPVGYGVPAMTLSTNMVFLAAHETLAREAKRRGGGTDGASDPRRVAGGAGLAEFWTSRADALRRAIGARFGRTGETGLAYLVDRVGRDDRQEGIGWAFAVLFDLYGVTEARALMEAFHTMGAGAPALYPNYERYERTGEIGRHCTTVWPHVQAFVALAAHRAGVSRLLAHELETLRAAVEREPIFHEIYHPETGLPFAGVQEGPYVSISCRRQTWAAQGYLAMLMHAVGGLATGADGVWFAPHWVREIGEVRLTGVWLRGVRRMIVVRRGARPGLTIDGRAVGLHEGEEVVAADTGGNARPPVGDAWGSARRTGGSGAHATIGAAGETAGALPALPPDTRAVFIPWGLLGDAGEIVVTHPGVGE